VRSGDYLRTAWTALGRQPGRTVLTVAAMAISATIVMTLAAISLGLGDAARTTLTPDAAMTHVVVTPARTAATANIFGGAQEVSKGDDKLTDDVLRDLGTAAHVQSATPVAEIWEFKSFRIAGFDTDFVSQTAGITGARSPLAAGRGFAAPAVHEVILGAGYAKELGLEPDALVGKQITFTTQNGYIGDGAAILPPTASLQQAKDYTNHATKLTATVAGVLAPGQDESRLFIPMGWARDIRTHRTQTASGEQREDQIAKDGYSSIILRADSPAHVEAVVAAVDDRGFGAISTLSQLKKIMQFSTVIWVGLGAIAVVTLLAGALGIVNTMLTAVAEQRYAIAVWRASGATKGVISRMFIMQSLLMGLLGAVIGAGLSYMAVGAANQQLRSLLEAQHVAVVDVATLPWWLIVAGIVITTLFAVTAGLYPAWRAARQDPSVALAGN
jgi:putative ABC transport system permease protein